MSPLLCSRSRAGRLALAVGTLLVGVVAPATATAATQYPVKLDGIGVATPLAGGGSFGLYRFNVQQASGGAQPTNWVAPFTEASNGTHTRFGHCVELDQGAGNSTARLRSGDDLSFDNPGKNTITPGDDDVRVAQLEWLLASSYLHRADADYANGIAAGAHQSAVWKIVNPGNPANDIGTAVAARATADAMADALLAGAVANAAAMDPAGWRLTVGGDPGATCAGTTRTLVVHGSPSTTAHLAITAGTATFGNGQTTIDAVLGEDGIAEVALVDTGDGADTVAVQATLPDWILAQGDNGGQQDFAYLIAGAPEVETLSVVFAPCEQLGLSVTAAPSFTRTYGWDVAKSAGTPVVDRDAGTATIPYTVTATRSTAADTGFGLSGTVTVTNPNADAVAATLDVSVAGATCVAPDTVLVPGGGTASAPLSCTLPAAPTGPVVAHATVTWTRAGLAPGTAAADSAAAGFDTPTTTVDATAQVLDAFAGGAAVPLGTCTGATCAYPLQRQVALPDTGCTDVTNVAIVRNGEAVLDTSAVTTSVCRPAAAVATGTTPPAPTTIAVTKTADRTTARAGGLVRFTIRVRATGKAAALDVRVCDRLPTSMAFVEATGATFSRGRACWTRARLAAGRSITYTVVARLDRGVGVGRACNTANVTATNARPVRATVCIATRPVAGQVRGGIVGVTG